MDLGKLVERDRDRRSAAGGSHDRQRVAPDGPEQCSGLPVQRHTRESLTETLAPTFSPVDFTPERHLTPAGVAHLNREVTSFERMLDGIRLVLSPVKP